MSKEWTIKRLRDHLGMDCHTSDHVLDMLAKEIEQQLAAEREKVEKIENDLAAGQIVAQRLLKVVEQLPDVKFNSPTFKKTIEELQDVCRGVDTEIIERVVAEKTYSIMEQLAVERESEMQLRKALAIELEHRQKAEEELAAEREKYQRSQEKVREYFDLLAAERAKPKYHL